MCVQCVCKSCIMYVLSKHKSVHLVAINPCESNNGGCSDLCLLSTAPGGRTCACPDGRGYQLAENQRDCIGIHCMCEFWMGTEE